MKVFYIDNRECFVDDEDYGWLMLLNWRLNTGYAVTGHKSATMQRLILRVPNEIIIDHIDGNKLNNTRVNLRVATARQNAQNRKPRKSRISPYKGVTKINSKWRARIQVNGERIDLGRFYSDTDAALAYDKAAKIYFKEFAYLNFK